MLDSGSESESEILTLVQRFISREENSHSYLIRKCQSPRRAKRFVRKTNTDEQARLLSAALDQEDLVAFDNLLTHGVSPNAIYCGYTTRVVNSAGRFNVLRQAINHQRTEYVRCLVRHGAKVNHTMEVVGDTETWPRSSVIQCSNVHRAVELENSELVKILITAGADLCVRSKFKSQPLHQGLVARSV